MGLIKWDKFFSKKGFINRDRGSSVRFIKIMLVPQSKKIPNRDETAYKRNLVL